MVLAAVVGALAFGVTGAAAAEYVFYGNWGDGEIGPGGFHQTGGWAPRDHNRSCVLDDQTYTWGYLANSYWNTNMDRVHYTGSIYTDRAGHKAALEGNGYYRSRCANVDYVAFRVVCQTTNGYF
jgi:hypothetical protein